MINAILKEIDLRQNYTNEDIETIYFGGGTPSLLGGKNLERILAKIYDTYRVNPAAELTLEANPEDISSQKANELWSLGFNRVSLGIQSFDDHVLKYLNRVHSADEASESVQHLQNAGFENITVDLIYGIAEQSSNIWSKNIARAVGLNVPHISSYALTIEDKTTFGNWLKKGQIIESDDSKYEKEYYELCEYLALNGFEHYEVSNFAKPGYKSRHNYAYWSGLVYIGLGPGAHSFNGKSRQFNRSNNAGYIKSLDSNTIPYTEEILSETEQYNELLLTGLRSDQGINLARIEKKFKINILANNGDFIRKCTQQGLAKLDNDRFILTEKGFFLADSIIIELMIDPLDYEN